MKAEISDRRPLLWPWGLFVFATFVVNAFLHTLLIRANFGVATFQTSLAFVSAGGLVSGELCICLVFSGLWGRHWLTGFAAATGLAWIGLLFLLAGQVATQLWVDQQCEVAAFFPLFLVPPIIFLSSLALLGFRSLRGWRLTRELEAPRWASLSIADLIVTTAFAAALLTFCRTTMEVMKVPVFEYLMLIGSTAATYCSASLVALVPIVWIVFRDQNRRVMKLSVLIVIDCFVVGDIALGMNQWSGPRLPAGTVFALTVTWLAVAFVYTIVGLTLLRLAGFRLHVRRDADAI